FYDHVRDRSRVRALRGLIVGARRGGEHDSVLARVFQLARNFRYTSLPTLDRKRMGGRPIDIRVGVAPGRNYELVVGWGVVLDRKLGCKSSVAALGGQSPGDSDAVRA